jgi:hypothetical protein
VSDEEVVPLREYVDQRFTDNAKLYDERDIQGRRQLETAREAMERRLEGMNQIRDQLREQAASFVSRSELALLVEKLQTMQGVIDRSEGRRTATTAFISAATSVAVGVIVYYLTRR